MTIMISMKHIKTILLWGVIIILVNTFVVNIILGIIQRTFSLSPDVISVFWVILGFGATLYLARQSIIRITETVSQGNAIMIGLFEGVVAVSITFIPFLSNGVVNPIAVIAVLLGGAAGGYLASKK